MKSRNSWILGFILFAFFATVGLGVVVGRKPGTDLQLKVESSKDTFMLGEPIMLDVELLNTSGKDLVLVNTFDPTYGSLKIYSRSGQKSVEYMNPKWGILELNGITKIKANEGLSNNVSVLARLEPENVAKFFYTKAGTYSVKVSYEIRYPGQEKAQVLESDPIELRIVEPVGDDLTVWNRMKNNGAIGYFIQHGDTHILSYKTEERKKLKEEVEQIIEQYPDSFYAASLTDSLANFNAAEAQREQRLETLRGKP